MTKMNHNTAVIVPTTFNRISFLIETVESIINSNIHEFIFVLPRDTDFSGARVMVDKLNKEHHDFKVSFLIQEGTGIANALNCGFRNLGNGIEYATWIGDDDLLTPAITNEGVKFLQENHTYNTVFGNCHYINQNGERMWVNNFGEKAIWISSFGPNLIPQPGSIFRFSALKEVGFLNESFHNSFDHDLYLKLKRIGKIKYLPTHLGSFRWHPDSLSYRRRSRLCWESTLVRIKNRNNLFTKIVQITLEPFIFMGVYFAPIFVLRTKKSRKF